MAMFPKLGFKLLLTLAFVVSASYAFNFEPSKSLPTDRGRIKIVDFYPPGGGQPYKVLRAENGNPLRGACTGLTKTTDTSDTTWEDIFQAEYFKRLKDQGFNTLKLAAYDGIWNGINFSDSVQVDSTLDKFEKIINLTSHNGMYSVITWHPKFGVDPEGYMAEFWKVFAPKFGNRTNVIFELTNEPYGSILGVTDEDFRKYKRIYDIIRYHAPQTHIMHFSCALISGGDSTHIKNAIDKFSTIANVNWNNSSVGYHLYFTDLTASPLRVLHRSYPAFPTEQNFPKTPEYAVLYGVRDNDPHRSRPMDGQLFAVQTAEMMGAGWFHWHFETNEKFDALFPLLKSDAISKGYFWGLDPYQPPVGIAIKGIGGKGNIASIAPVKNEYFRANGVKSATKASGILFPQGMK